MRNRNIKWHFKVGSHSVTVTISTWTIKGTADYMGFDDNGDCTHIEPTRSLEMSFSYRGVEESGTRSDGGCLWYLTTSRPLTRAEYENIKHHGTLPEGVTYEVITRGGDGWSAGTQTHTIRAVIKTIAREATEEGIEYDAPAYRFNGARITDRSDAHYGKSYPASWSLEEAQEYHIELIRREAENRVREASLGWCFA